MFPVGEASPPLDDVEDAILGEELGDGTAISVGCIDKAAIVNGRSTTSTAAKMRFSTRVNPEHSLSSRPGLIDGLQPAPAQLWEHELSLLSLHSHD
jgi:hypothetical protein